MKWLRRAIVAAVLLAALSGGGRAEHRMAAAQHRQQSAIHVAAAMRQPAAKTYIFAAHATTLVAHAPSGPAVAALNVAAPLQVVSRHGAWATVLFTAWARASGGRILYVDTGAIGSAIRGGQVVAALPKPSIVKMNKDTGVTWDKVLLAGVVQINNTVTNLNTLWKPASMLYTSHCGVCHALHAPNQFTSERWPANIKAMAHNTALTPADLDLVLKYLQWHASDMAHTGS